MIKAKIKNLLYKTLSRIFEIGDLPAPHWTKTVSITAGSSLDVVFNFADTADGFDMSGYRLLTLNTITMSGTYSEYIALCGFSISNGKGTFAVKIRSLAASSTITATVQVYGIAIKKLGGYCVTSVFSRLSAIASHLKGWWHHVNREEVSVQGSLVSWWRRLLEITHKRMSLLQEERNSDSNVLLGIEKHNDILSGGSNSARRVSSCFGYVFQRNDSKCDRPSCWCYPSEREYKSSNSEWKYNLFGIYGFIPNSRVIGSSISERGWSAC